MIIKGIINYVLVTGATSGNDIKGNIQFLSKYRSAYDPISKEGWLAIIGMF